MLKAQNFKLFLNKLTFQETNLKFVTSEWRFFFQEEETSFHTLLTKSHRELTIVSISIDIDIYVYTYTYIYMYLLLYNLRHTLEMFVLT